MSKSVQSIDRIALANPCDSDWESMIGNDQVRFCEHCNLHVTNLSSMTREDAMRVVARSRGRICVRYIERTQGGVLTLKMPEKLYRIGRRASRIAAGAFTATLSLSSAAQTHSQSTAQPKENVEVVKTTSDREIVTDDFSANVSGTIKTKEGELITNATVMLVDRESGEERMTTSSNAGQYSFQLLPRGDYLLWVRKPTFRTAREVVNVAAGVAVQQDIEIQKRMLYGIGGAMASASIEEGPLLKAINQGDVEAVRALVFEPLKFGRLARATLHLADAVQLGNRQIVQVLLDAGADPNFRGGEKNPALLSLSDKATPELVQVLILAGAKLNARDDYGDTALMIASLLAQPAVVKELINAGAQINATNSAGETALFAATRSDNSGVLTLLLNAGINVDVKNESGENALMAMLPDASFEDFKTLLDRGSDATLVNDEGKTSLMLAAQNGDSKIMGFLISRGASLNWQDNYGDTALTIAASTGLDGNVVLLVKAGADPNLSDLSGLTALMKASIRGSVETVRVLLECGADPTARDEDGKTALSHARESNNEEVIAFLKSRGAPK